MVSGGGGDQFSTSRPGMGWQQRKPKQTMEFMMKRTTLAAALALPAVLSVAAIGYASSQSSATLDGIAVGDTIGTTHEAINARLTDLGYAMTELENDEDGYIEVELVAGSQAFELEIDVANGTVLEIEAEDGEDGDDDGD